MEDDHKAALDREQKQVNFVYAAIAAMLILSLIPSIPVQVVAFLLLIFIMASIYALRARAEPDSLVRNHMDYLIRTFWISSLLFLIGFAVAVIWLAREFDVDAVMAMLGMLTSGHIVITRDIRFLALASLVTIGPSVVYFIYRAAKGLHRAINGHRMGNVKGWL